MVKFSFVILIFFSSKVIYSQDTISLSQIQFNINSCEIDTNQQKFDFLTHIDKNQKYKLIYKEYVIPGSSAYYAECRSNTLQNFLDKKYSLKIIDREANTIIKNNKSKKKESKKVPINKEIFLIKVDY